MINSITKVKSMDVPLIGAHWSYGPDFMRRISKPQAMKLCDPFGIPEMCYEVDIDSCACHYGFAYHLTIQNISGHFYIACANAKITEWPDLFKIEII